ncbi:Aminodeoxychorismate lyase [Smittium culicis]|uniref:Aminodeoxychorismate lyase n=1 Tax=Smittium culicis TaxID=133412 RepID=A0A1R1YRU2_9FUNG|nr:Aminodeoxychorismate lyase [Smittium culicis]
MLDAAAFFRNYWSRLEHAANTPFADVPSKASLMHKVQSHVGTVMNSVGADTQLRVRFLMDTRSAVSVTATIEPDQTADTEKSIILSSFPIDTSSPFVKYKTTHRDIYNHAKAVSVSDYEKKILLLSKQGSAQTGGTSSCEIFDVLMYNNLMEITETCIANISAIAPSSLERAHPPSGRHAPALLSNPRNGAEFGVTPSLDCGLLGGTMRAFLLRSGKLDTIDKIYVDDLLKISTADDLKLYCFNSVRGVYPVKLL